MAKPGKSGDQTLDNMYNIVHGDEQESAPMIDPIAYRSDYRPEDIKADWRSDPNIPGVGPRGANEHFNEYGDDSNPSWQGFKGGLNEKYTGEGVKTSMVDYDPNITTGGLDPNYMFGDAARNSDTKESGYLAKRNDMIASALYNEGKVSREDVANYLSAQKGWFDSTEADRQNTIESVWKRLGQYAPKEEEQQHYDAGAADEIVKDNSGELYGKTTADEGNPKKGIQTLSDDNSVFTMMEEARANNLKALIANSPLDIATALDAGALPGTLQSIRDLQQYYPEYWEEVQQYRKKNKTQNEVNAITNGTQSDTENNGQSVINNANADFANNNAGSIKTSQEITKDVNDSLAKNQTANEASETMASIEEDMAILKNRLKNLKLEASQAFKGDVPDYLVNAYIANKSQEIQNQMQILEDRYNMAYSRYKDEVANTQWEKEFELKKEELKLKKESLALEEYKVKNGTSSSSSKSSGTSTVTDDNGNQIAVKNDEDLAAAVDYLLEQFDYGKLGNGQCAAGIQKYYFPLIGISIGNLSSFDRKKSLINEEKGYTPKKGDLIILSSKSSPENGHIGIVIGVEGGYVQFLDWNGSLGKDGKGTEKAAINSMPIDSAKIQGYRNVNKGQDGIYNRTTNSDTNRKWTETDYSQFEKFLEATSDSARKSIARGYGYGDDLEGFTNLVRDALENRNKSTDTDTDASTDWEDSDYSAFEKFMDSETSKSDLEAIAEKYGYKGNLKGMTDFVKKQLKARKDSTNEGGDTDNADTNYARGVSKNDPRLKEEGFDPVKGFNPSMYAIYDTILDNPSGISGDWIANQEAGHNRKQGQLAEEAKNYQKAKNEGYDAYGLEKRGVDKELGFVKGKDSVYQAIIANDFTIPGTQQDFILRELGLDPSNKNAATIAAEEALKFQEYNKQVLNQDLEEMLFAIEYMIAQDATSLQRSLSRGTGTSWYNNWFSRGEGDTWGTEYNYVKNNLTLDHFLGLKKDGATFGALSNYELQMIAAAASNLDKSSDSDTFRQNLDKLYNTVRKTLGRKELSEAELDKMWNAEDGSDIDMSNFIVLDHLHKTGPLGGSNYRRYGSSDYNKGTDGYNKYGPRDTAKDLETINDIINGEDEELQDDEDDADGW